MPLFWSLENKTKQNDCIKSRHLCTLSFEEIKDIIEVRLTEGRVDQQGHTSSKLERIKVNRVDMWVAVVVVLGKMELELE